VIDTIADDFYRVTLPMPFRLEHVHVYVLIHDGKVTLFDTGINTPDTFSTLEEALHRIGMTLHDIDHIFITHYHADHCGIAGGIKDISGAVIHTSEIGKRIRQYQQNEALVTEKVRTFYLAQGLAEDVVQHLLKLIQYFRTATMPYDVDECVIAGETYTLGERSFEVLPTPGHARDHVCYYFRQEGLLLAGDHVLPDITPNLSPDLLDPDFRALSSFITALQGLSDLSVTRVFPAHGEPFTNLKKRIDEITDHHEERKALTLRALRHGPKNTFQVSQDIFGPELPEFDKFLALNETYVHLVELLHDGLIAEEDAGGRMIFHVV
jgi:glyoxylase-like metal-dependent hydrolase (beta-lactamase superfamily II)